jgi:hypothetical protein
MGLVALVGTQLGQTLLVGRRSPFVWATVAGSGIALVAIVQTPGVSHFFGCVPLGPVAWTTVAGSAIGATGLAAVLPYAYRTLVTPGLPVSPVGTRYGNRAEAVTLSRPGVPTMRRQARASRPAPRSPWDPRQPSDPR